ncbi:hypothetical protein OAP63_08250 [Vibrio sp.]|uniref:Uncharacterized protein n=1 Tax=Vibrio viridaestus TaxID=2487322 RepID=A0A3N9THX1_9VIBR|nr:hypothetical protein [Vibrio viridaestus]MDC0610711.1 hypothetical protein [Vibrio sp.]RQW63660.1 hypothetical protein EES38_10480 [Vibrio viridaestus]
MIKFIKFLQIAFAVVVLAVLAYDVVLHGVTIFNQKYVILTSVLWVVLELALFVIFKLIEDD